MIIDRHDDDQIGRAHRKLYDVHATLPESSNLQAAFSRIQPDGKLTGLKCLDLSCGTGRWARLMHAMGAESVLGIDDNSNATNQARAWMPLHAKNLTFYDYTTSEPNPAAIGTFDVVLASNLTSVASSHQLTVLLQRIAALLNPNGRLIALYPDLHYYAHARMPLPRKYGVTLENVMTVYEGNNDIGYHANLVYHTGGPIQSFRTNILHHHLVTTGAKETGFGQISWTKAFVPNALKQDMPSFPAGHWDAYEEHPYFVVLECTKEESGMAGMGDASELARLAEVRVRDEVMGDESG